MTQPDPSANDRSRACTRDSCPRPHHAKGLCSRHYEQARTHAIRTAYKSEHARLRRLGQPTVSLAAALRERQQRADPATEVAIEQAIARGQRTSAIMRDLHATYPAVANVRDRLNRRAREAS